MESNASIILSFVQTNSSSAISPIFAPLGFATWQAGIAILTGLVAKEVVVSTFGTLAGVEEDDEEGMSSMIQGLFTPLNRDMQILSET